VSDLVVADQHEVLRLLRMCLNREAECVLGSLQLVIERDRVARLDVEDDELYGISRRRPLAPN
jgi:hypothetical protein